MDTSTLNTILGVLGGAFGIEVIKALRRGWDTRQRARANRESETDRLRRELYEWQGWAYHAARIASEHGATREELGTPPSNSTPAPVTT